MNYTQKYDHYYRFSEIEEKLKYYAEKYPEYVRLTSLNKTDEGRDIWLVEITDTSSGDFDEKPAFYVAGHFHAKEFVGMMVSLYFMDLLLTNKDDDKQVMDLLNTYTVAMIPEPTPDGYEFVRNGGDCRSVNKVTPPRADLPDGIYGHDLDGDGAIRLMRKKDPDGPWKVHPEDDRLMVKRKPYETDGDFYYIYREGLVKGDPETCCFDAPDPYGNDLNRGYPTFWASAERQPGAGQYAMENVESRTIVDLLLKKKNMCAFLVYHTATGCMFYPPASIDPDECPKEDMQRYIDVGNMIKDSTGFDFCNIHRMTQRDGYPTFGSFDDYSYISRGVFTYAIELWDMAKRTNCPIIWQTPKNEPDSILDERQMNFIHWLDDNGLSKYYKNWEKFDHPQLGEVEIGGSDMLYIRSNPPVELLMEEMDRAVKSLFEQIQVMPRIEIDDVEVSRRADGYYDVDATVINRKYFPTNVTRQIVQNRLVHEDSVSLAGEGISFVSGKPVENIGFIPGFCDARAMGKNGIYGQGRPQNRKRVHWVIDGEPGQELVVRAASDKAGISRRKIVLE